MGSFKLGKEIQKGVLSSCHERGTQRKKSTSLILAVCRTGVIHEIRKGPCSPQSVCGLVVEHRSTESERLRFDSSWGLRIFSLSHARDKTVKHLSLFFFFLVNACIMVDVCTCTVERLFGLQFLCGNDTTRSKRCKLEQRDIDGEFSCLIPLHPNISMHILHTVLYTFPKVLTRRICLTIKSFFSE